MMTFKTLLHRSKHGRVMILAVAGVVLAALFVGTGLMSRPRRPAAPDRRGDREAEFQVSVDDSRKVAGFVERFGPRIDDTEKRLADREEELKTLKGRQEKFESILTNLLEAFQADHTRQEKEAKEDKSGSKRSDASSRRDAQNETPLDDARAALGRLSKVTLALAHGDSEGRKKKKEASVRIPAGSFAEATLLTGVYAPTEGGALPVQMRLDMTFLGPNHSRVPIQGAFLIGKAVGDPNSRRVTVQLSKLSYVKSSGEVVEVSLNGYVADADGVQGLAGQYVWRVRETMGLAMTAGGISALSDAAAARATTTQITPLGGAQTMVTGDIGTFAAFRGAARAADELEKLVVKRLDQVVPAIYIPNAKKITVCLIDGVTLEGLLVSEVKNAASTNPYAGMDLDR